MPSSSQKAGLFIMQLMWQLVSTLLPHGREGWVSIHHSSPVMVLLAPCGRKGRKARMRHILLRKLKRGVDGNSYLSRHNAFKSHALELKASWYIREDVSKGFCLPKCDNLLV